MFKGGNELTHKKERSDIPHILTPSLLVCWRFRSFELNISIDVASRYGANKMPQDLTASLDSAVKITNSRSTFPTVKPFIAFFDFSTALKDLALFHAPLLVILVKSSCIMSVVRLMAWSNVHRWADVLSCSGPVTPPLK